MKILWVELNPAESLSIYPASYGGSSRVPAWLKEYLGKDQLTILAPHACFRDYVSGGEYLESSFGLCNEAVEQIRAGSPISNYITGDYDLVVHANPGLYLNLGTLKAKQTVWAVGQYEKVHPEHTYLLLHNPENQHPQIQAPLKAFAVILGVPLPKFVEYVKKDQICQVSNHYPQINTAFIADWCCANGIEFKFAGPVNQDYHIRQLPKIVDYLGIISETDKINLFQKSIFYTCFHTHEINETPLSAKQAASYGCGILTFGAGHLGKFVKHGVNGYFVESYEDLDTAWENRHKIKQQDCYNNVRRYSLENMVESFYNAFKQICSI